MNGDVHPGVPGGPAIVDERAQVMSVEKGSGGACRALLLAPQIARKARPLQFIMVRVAEGMDPFLRRPFGLSLIDPDSGLIRVTWDVVGRGTRMMAAWEPGKDVDVLGPLGNGFEPGAAPVAGAGTPRMFIIAGGTGLAPMLPLAAVARSRGWDVALYYGARSSGDLLDTAEFEGLGCAVTIATDDGTAGLGGFVTSVASSALNSALPGEFAVACGPTPMMRAVKPLCVSAGVPLYVSLEERMACGTGLCRGCAVKAARADQGYYHVCSDGPVFRAEDVDLGGRQQA